MGSKPIDFSSSTSSLSEMSKGRSLITTFKCFSFARGNEWRFMMRWDMINKFLFKVEGGFVGTVKLYLRRSGSSYGFFMHSIYENVGMRGRRILLTF